MRDPMDDYRQLLGVAQDQGATALRSAVPQDAGAQWISAMLDIAITDYYFVNRKLANATQLRFEVAGELLRLAQVHNLMRQSDIVAWYLRFARKAVTDHVERIPAAMTVDNAVQRAVSSIGLTRNDALSASIVRRQKYQALLDSLQPSGVWPSRVVGIENEQLLYIQSLLPKIFWFVNFIHDAELAGEVAEWFAIANRLGLGPEISQQLKRS
jgi:hypothetical protein